MRILAHIIKAIPRWVPTIVVLLLIAYISLDKDPFYIHKVPLFKGADKIIHFIMYLTLSTVSILDYAKTKMPHHTKLNGELAFTVTAAVLGLVFEVLQGHFSEFRQFDFYDIAANIAGAFAGFLLCRFWLLHQFRKMMVPLYSKHRHHHRYSESDTHRHHHHHHHHSSSTDSTEE